MCKSKMTETMERLLTSLKRLHTVSLQDLIIINNIINWQIVITVVDFEFILDTRSLTLALGEK